MTEKRKFAILFASTIIAARKLMDLDPNKPNMAKGYFVDRAMMLFSSSNGLISVGH